MSTTLDTFDPTKTFRRPFTIVVETTRSRGTKDLFTRPVKPYEKGHRKGTHHESTTGAQRFQDWKQRRNTQGGHAE